MKYRTRKVVEFVVDGLTAELSNQPSSVMDYVEHKVEKQGGLVVVGYLVDDSDAQNPLEDCDGMGHIYSAHRHSGQHSKMQAALGLDSDWGRDYSLVEKQAKKALLELVYREYKPDVVAFIIESANKEEPYRMNRDEAMEHFIHDFTGQLPYHRETRLTLKVREKLNWDDLLEQAWSEGRTAGTVGDPYAVMLDCYEHGGQHWSLSGGGMQCAFDTARGAGVWIPDQYLRDELDSIRTSDSLDAARSKAEEFARQALGQFNAWLSGDCYGVAMDVFVTEGERLKLIDESAVWGYVGREWAEEAMSDEVRSILNHAVLQAA